MFKITTSKQVMSLVVMGLALVVLIISHNYFQLNAKVELLNLSNNIKEKETLLRRHETLLRRHDIVTLEKFNTETSSASGASASSIICNRTPLSVPAPRIEEIANQFTSVKEDLRNAIYNNQLYESSLTAASMLS